ncbi:hypothetical protein EGN72_13525 [Pseudorhodobacter sp. E13]|uniref:DM13 domain-containing protein n=1 Tax=Pseudorhodobacter sp. E13 TaxID=2487931 RepID=UPI000F8F5BBF|nr:DM13 domain-containing protein [Pseudorhodobacter sp. E13]RUS59713.1 hypothetical protein EGN72_13525 [Pseudorhodobacter sp. E13]
MLRRVALGLTHLLALALGFALGVYFLPILTAPPSLGAAALQQEAQGAMFTANFNRALRGSDFLHWGEGKISVLSDRIVHEGSLAPGPDYKMYLVAEFVEHEDEFLPRKAGAQLIGDVKTFDGVVVPVPEGVDVSQFTTVVIWCESFGEFITSAQYR